MMQPLFQHFQKLSFSARMLFAAAVIGLLCISILLLPSIHTYLSARMENFADATILALESGIGRPISYSSINPNIILGLQLHDFTIYRDSSYSERLIRIGSVNIKYSIIDLLRGKIVVTAIHIRDIQLNEISNDPQGLRAFISDILSQEGSVTFSDTAEIFFENISVNIEYPVFDGDVHISRAVLRNTSEGRQFVIASSIYGTAGVAGSIPVQGDITASGKVSTDFSTIDANVSIKQLHTHLFSMQNQNLGIQVSSDTITIRRQSAREPFEISVSFSPEEQAVSVGFAAQDYRLTNVLEFSSQLSWINPLISGTISGNGELNMHVGSKNVDYALDISANYPNFAGYGNVSAQLQAQGNRQFMSIDRASLQTRSGSISYNGTIALVPYLNIQGTLSIRDLFYNDLRLIRSDLAIQSFQDRIQLIDESPLVSSADIGKIALSITTNRSWGVGFSAFIGLDAENRSNLRFQGVLPPLSSNASIRLRYRLQGLPGPLLTNSAQQILRLSFPQGIITQISPLRVSSSGFLQLSSDSFQLSSPFVSFFSADATPNRLSFSVSASPGLLDIQEITGSIMGSIPTGQISIQEISQGRSITADLKLDETPYSLAGIILDSGEIHVQGSYNTLFSAQAGASGLIFQGEFDEVPIPFASESPILSASFFGSFESSESFAIQFTRLTANNLSITHLDSFSCPALIRSGRIYAPELILSSHNESYSGNIDFRYQPKSISSLADFQGRINAELSSPEKERLFRFSLQTSGQNLSGNFLIQNIALPYFVHPDLSGESTISGTIAGRKTNPVASGNFSIQQAFYSHLPITARSDFSLSLEHIGFYNLSATYQGLQLNPLDVGINIVNRSISAQGGLTLSSLVKQETQITFALSGTLGKDWNNDSIFTDENINFRGQFAVSREGSRASDDYSISIQGTGDSLLLEGGYEGEGIYAEIQQDGNFEFDIYDPLAIQAQGYGTYQDQQIEMDIPNIYVDISQLGKTFSLPQFSLHDGSLQGSLRIIGNPEDPDMYGTINIVDLKGEASLSPAELHIPYGSIVFEERTIRLGETRLAAGKVDARISAAVQLSRLIPEEYQVVFATLEENWFPVTQDFGPVAVDGLGSVDLLISGNQNQISITGDIIARNTSIVLVPNEDLIETEENPNFNFITDLTIRSGRGVEFFWPNQQVPIVRTFAKIGEGIRIQSSRQDRFFSLKGAVAVQGGEIFYFQRSFYIREGEIVFNESEDKFDPRISFRADIREVSDDGDVTISLLAEQNPLSRFSPRFSSSPPLSDTEILTLLGSNLLAQDEDVPEDSFASGPGGALTLTVLDTVGQLAVSRTIESQIRESLGLDMFSIRSPVIQNIGSPLDTTTPSLGQYLDNTSIFMGRFIGNDIFGELLIQLSAQDPFSDESRNLTGMEVASEISLEFDTPFFDLEWQIAPNNWEQLFVPDNQFSFKWGFSY